MTPFAELIERCRREERVRFDLTQTNPTQVGLPYDAVGIARSLGTADAHEYQPECLGAERARRAIAELWAQRGVDVPHSHVVLTASTSEAYSILFKLFCDPGTAVLVPTPSYPLFAELARYDDVELIPYPLAFDGAWHIDKVSFERAFNSRVRAVIGVSPNNPTGSITNREDAALLASLGVPVISDEVFWAYPLEGLPSSSDPSSRRAPSSIPPSSIPPSSIPPSSIPPSSGSRSSAVAGGDGVNRNPAEGVPSLTSLLEPDTAVAGLFVTLDGLSKYAALPGLKLGWMTFAGAPRLVADALGRLEFILDAYLSVNAPVQRALPELLRISAPTRVALRQRLAQNLAALDQRLLGAPVTRLPVHAGWSVVLRLPRVVPDLQWVSELLEREGVLTQPGLFYDFDVEGTLVISLLPEPETFSAGIERLLQHVHRVCA